MPLSGTAGNDTLTATAPDYILNGLAGDDTLIGGSTYNYFGYYTYDFSWMLGYHAVDRTYFAAPGLVQLPDQLNGGLGDDMLIGGQGSDWLTGGDGNDLVRGQLGDDFMVNGAGTDRYIGGDGQDTFVVEANAGSQRFRINLSQNKILNDSFGKVEKILGVEHVRGATDRPNELIGKSGTNVLTGGNKGDKLVGLGGDDVLKGGAGRDVYLGGHGNDWANVAASQANGIKVNLMQQKVVDDGSGNTETIKGVENLYGTANSDVLVGDNRANIFASNGGADTINGKGGVDTLISGPEAMVADLRAGTFSIMGAQGTVNNVENLVGSLYAADTLLGDGGNNVLVAGGAQVITDFLIGIQPGDVLRGRGGNDKLIGTGVDVQMFGGSGNDRLISAFGHNDELTGGPGSDVFVFKGNAGASATRTVKDFEDDVDTVRINASEFGLNPNLSATDVINTYGTTVNGHAALDFGGELIVFEGVTNLNDLSDDLVLF
ncbi:calcium-binding protein [Aliiroseovarius sp. S253]|uniref:calcium-binding protein n=1 Tax=Aliiroseovarius sp. S253 TaxID=3415133 RepID=UPI003C7EA0E0